MSERKMKTLIDYRTGKVLATVGKHEITAWCLANDYLPHHWTMRGLVVITK